MLSKTSSNNQTIKILDMKTKLNIRDKNGKLINDRKNLLCEILHKFDESLYIEHHRGDVLKIHIAGYVDRLYFLLKLFIEDLNLNINLFSIKENYLLIDVGEDKDDF